MEQIVRTIHVSARVESPACEIAGRMVPVFPHIFRVVLDRHDVPEHGAVVTLMYCSQKAQVLKAYWVCSPTTAEKFLQALPHPTSITTNHAQPVVRSSLMTNKDWDAYLNQWLSMNELPSCRS